MYCRTCGKEVPGQAVVCLGCGCLPSVGDKFCRRCGGVCGHEDAGCRRCGAAPGAVRSTTRPATRPVADVMIADSPRIGAPLPPVVVGLAIFFFFPLGLYLLRGHPVLGRNKTWWWAGGTWGFFVFLGAMNGDKGKKPGVAEVVVASPAPTSRVVQASPIRPLSAIVESRQPQPVATTEKVRAVDEPTAYGHAPDPGVRASTGRHQWGFRTSSWDYKNGCQVIYDGSVTKPEAKRLGDYLEIQGVFDGDVKTFKVDKVGKTYEFRAVIKKGLDQDPETIEGMKQMASELSRSVFGGSEVDVHLCDENFRTIRVVVP